MQMQLHTMAYTSKANKVVDRQTFMALLFSAQRFNASVDVTGLLVLSDSVEFVQTIEGSAEAIGAVYARIAQDPLHADIAIFADEEIDNRVYPDWAMTGNCERAASTLIEFVNYALVDTPKSFTRGQNRAMTMMRKRLETCASCM